MLPTWMTIHTIIMMVRLTSTNTYILCKTLSDGIIWLDNQLLEKDPIERLETIGLGKVDLLTHTWFEGLDLITLRKKQVKAPLSVCTHS